MDPNLAQHIPSNIMKAHDPNDDPFAALADDTNQLQSPLEYGSGISYFIPKEDSQKEHTKTDDSNANDANDKVEKDESESSESSESSTEE